MSDYFTDPEKRPTLTFSKSMQKRIEAQTGEKLYTQAELDERVRQAVAEAIAKHSRLDGTEQLERIRRQAEADALTRHGRAIKRLVPEKEK